MHPVLSSFLYVLCAFALIALIVVLAVAGNGIAGPAGAISGAVVGALVLTWAGCWFLEST